MTKLAHALLTLTAVAALIACSEVENRSGEVIRVKNAPPATDIPLSQLDKSYWYTGSAEITRYDLQQNRYRGVHPGEVVRIFVTEDFLTDKQVKNDNYVNDNSVSVLKMNDIRRFTTGLYDYSIMTSVFTRADGSATEKITLSSQDWCGQTWVQLNRKSEGVYSIELRSYFETEGDKNFTVKADLLEDELPNLTRIDPDLIPSGEVPVLPSLTSLRFTHGEHRAAIGKISKGRYTGSEITGDDLRQVQLDFPSSGRQVILVYDAGDQNKIVSWKESRKSGFDGEQRTTVAVKTHELYDAYWKLNDTSDEVQRELLGLN